MAAPTRIQLRVPPASFLRLGTSRLPETAERWTPGVMSTGGRARTLRLRETGTRRGGCHLAFDGADVHKKSVRIPRKIIK
jgi:hypothetical protein